MSEWLITSVVYGFIQFNFQGQSCFLYLWAEQPIEADVLSTAITNLEVVVKQWILVWYLGNSKKENK